MSIPLQFKLTQIGQAALWNSGNTGTALGLTYVQFGSGNRAPDGSETRLVTPQQATAIAAGFSVSRTQIRMSAIFSGTQSYPIREVGLWAGNPADAASKLVAYWSQANGDLAYKSAGVDFIFSHDMVLDNATPAGSLTIQADNAQSAMLAMLSAHEAKTDPHPVYLTSVEGDAKIAAHVALADPHSQYATDSDLTNHMNATDPHPMYLTSAEGDAKIAAHVALADPHSQYATDSDLTNHINASDPHTQYAQKSAIQTQLVPPGTILYLAQNQVPAGYLAADGATLSRLTYAALFTAIGTTFGAPDNNTFKLPDLRGEFIRGFDGGRGVDAGRGFGSWQSDLLKSHTHTTVQMIADNSVDGVDSTTTHSGEHHNEVRDTGATGGSETRPRNLALLACIKY